MTINLCKKNLRGTKAMTINLQAGTQNSLKKEKKIENQFENQFAGWNSTLLETATDLLLDTPARLLGNISFVDDSQDFLIDKF